MPSKCIHGNWASYCRECARIRTEVKAAPTEAKSVDFAALRAQAKKALEESKANPKPTELDRIRHLIEFHLAQMTEWECSFCYSNRVWLGNPSHYMSKKAVEKLAELEQMYCIYPDCSYQGV